MALGLRGTKGVACPPFTAGPYEWDQFVTFTAGIGAANTVGQVFYVDPRGPEYGAGNDQNDGKSWSSALATIQAAVNKCVSKRGDIIYVGSAASAKNTVYFSGTTEYPDYRKIKENVLITKSNVHIIGVPFRSHWSHQFRASDGQGAYLDGSLAGSRTKYAISLYSVISSDAVGFVINAQDVEISGFCIDSGGAKVGMYIGDGSGITGTASESYNSAGAYIHDNYFIGESTGTTGAGIVLQGCASDVLIENNMFDKMDGFGIYIGSGSGKTNERPTIRGNHFKNVNGYGVYIYNSATNIQTLIHGNTFQDGSATMTAAIATAGTSPVHTLVSGNFFGCTTPLDLNTNDFFSGNFKCTASATETYVSEA